MNVTLKNDRLTVVISTFGAELQSITNADGLELIWQADKSIWGRHAPLLFPIIGRLKDQQYTLNGEVIHISQHGFARDSEFALTQQTENSVTFTLKDSEATKAVYPFAFTLSITYVLTDNTLKKIHTVTNRSETVMPYEVGGHDAYCTTLLPGETMSDYYLEFPNQDAIHPFQMDEICSLTPEKLDYPLSNGRLSLPPDVFGLDTIVLEKLPVNQVTLANTKNSVRLTVDFPEFDYLGIWTKQVGRDTNYICIEPWSTLPECTFVSSELSDKAGIRLLQPGQSEALSYTVTVEG
jgi:galactose mutarotase-like enzyme